jgi:hypothetical protein
MAGPQQIFVTSQEARKIAGILQRAAELLQGIDPAGAQVALTVGDCFTHAAILHIEGPPPPTPAPRP